MKKGGIYYVSNNLTLVATFYRNSLLTFGLLLSNSGNISCILKYIVYRSIIWERNTNIKQGHHLLCIFIEIFILVKQFGYGFSVYFIDDLVMSIVNLLLFIGFGHLYKLAR